MINKCEERTLIYDLNDITYFLNNYVETCEKVLTPNDCDFIHKIKNKIFDSITP